MSDDDVYEAREAADMAWCAEQEEKEQLRKVIYKLADALWPYRDDWDEQSNSSYNVARKAKTQYALDAARAEGWYPK
jgi:hypothetical protein